MILLMRLCDHVLLIPNTHIALIPLPQKDFGRPDKTTNFYLTHSPTMFNEKVCFSSFAAY